ANARALGEAVAGRQADRLVLGFLVRDRPADAGAEASAVEVPMVLVSQRQVQRAVLVLDGGREHPWIVAVVIDGGIRVTLGILRQELEAANFGRLVHDGIAAPQVEAGRLAAVETRAG